MATSPAFVSAPIIGVKQVTVANANRDGTGTVVDLVTGAANGTLISGVWIKATVTTTAGMIRLYIYDGTSVKLIKEIPVSAITVSATVAAFEYLWVPEAPLVLPNTYVLRASTEKAEAINVIPMGGNL